MKTCPDCKTDKLDSFGKDERRKDGLTRCCLACCRTQNRASYQRHKETHAKRTRRWTLKRQEENRRFLWDYKLSHPCVDCGEEDPRVLQFDHVRGEKTADVTELAFGNKVSTDRLTSEIAKCAVRCANCHLKETWASRGYKEPGGRAAKRAGRRMTQDKREHLRAKRALGLSYEALGIEFGVATGTAWRIVNKKECYDDGESVCVRDAHGVGVERSGA